MHSEILRAVADTLADLPGVRRSAVMVRRSAGGDHKLVAYLGSDDAVVERTFSSEDDETQRTEQWRKIYDLYQKPTPGASIETGFSARVWQSAYTKQPIPDHEMQEWIGYTLGRIRHHQPNKVLDIGCGLGTLLLRLGP